MKNNKKGFTLVELLAVIVILAVVALIGMTAIGPVMSNSRKAALKNDGLELITAAKTAYQAEGLKSTPGFRSIDSVCMSYGWLVANGYADGKVGYDGSVLVTYDPSTESYSYKYWLGNTEYVYLGANDSTGYEAAEVASKYLGTTVYTPGFDKYTKFDKGSNAAKIDTCGSNENENVKKCTATITYKKIDNKEVLTADDDSCS